MRKKINVKQGYKKHFKNTAKKTKAINITTAHNRGGIRM